MDEKDYMIFNMINYKSIFMVYRNLRQVRLQEVGLLQIMANHVNVQTLDENHGPL